MRPFTVLHVCMGNICRSPMAERLLVARLGAGARDLIVSHGAGTGDWHEGEPMNPPAARQVRARGGDPDSFRARGLLPQFVTGSDLVLTATAEQVEFVVRMVPAAAERTFVLGEFGRLAAQVDLAALPSYAPTAAAVAARGRALVAAVDARRDGALPDPADDLGDPWGRGEPVFMRTADAVERHLAPLVTGLAGP
ncbi:MAG: low molecular weight protein-tyrosine phosphatase [Actinomycetota bacterium]|nr:protein tyrosine phosphatase [Cryptosporangiaceae bacterium]MDQ1678924.1 low molecular weight protein-tyrosine phosphatase [Actinomycetota bacterium]